MENTVTRLFVYGSLRSGFHHPAYEYISKYFKLLSEARVKGRLYDMGSYPGAVPASDDVYIIGELYDLKNPEDFSWAIEQLDAYEGVDPEEGEEPIYKRELTEVVYGDKKTTAWIYWYVADLGERSAIASGDILQHIQLKTKL